MGLASFIQSQRVLFHNHERTMNKVVQSLLSVIQRCFYLVLHGKIRRLLSLLHPYISSHLYESRTSKSLETQIHAGPTHLEARAVKRKLHRQNHPHAKEPPQQYDDL
jgi:hypothetical protein